MIDLDGLKKLGLDSISLKVSGERGELNYINAEIEEWLDNEDINDKYMINIFITILGTNLDTDESVEIGKLTGNFFESELVMDDTDFYYLCDSIETDLEHMASAIVDRDGNIKEEICEFDENLMYIDRIHIKEKYRRLGITSYVIKSLNTILEYSVNLSPDVLIVLPVPQEIREEGLLCEMKNEEQKDTCKQKLVELYKRLGFKEIKKTNYMMKRTREDI